MIVLVLDVLSKFVQGPVDVFLFTGKKRPTWPRMKLLSIFFKSGRCVGERINCNRHEKNILAQPLTQRFLNPLKVAAHRWTYIRAAGEQRVNDHRPSF